MKSDLSKAEMERVQSVGQGILGVLAVDWRANPRCMVENSTIALGSLGAVVVSIAAMIETMSGESHKEILTIFCNEIQKADIQKAMNLVELQTLSMSKTHGET